MPDEPVIMDYRDEQRILLSTTLDASPAAIWAALTEEAQIHRWWGDHVALDPRPGGRFRERWSDGGGGVVVTTGEVVRVEPGELLELTWADEGWDVTTRVRFTLEPLDEGTRLVLEHQGWSDFPADEREEVMADHAAGWQRHLTNLARHLKNG
jgi:uncharacterized protein YndB with AHSA1/START domain